MTDCIFCKIIAGDIPAEMIHQDEDLIAFRDIDPKAPVHVLIVPRRHIVSLGDSRPEDRDLLGGVLLLARELAARENVAKGGYRLVTNCGDDGGQSVDHLHFHLLGGRAMRWPPG